MSHAYPIAENASAALTAPEPSARTRVEAIARAGKDAQISLRSEWLTLSPAAAKKAAGNIERAVEMGFVQRYEDADGRTVLAVTFWTAEPLPKPDRKPPATARTPSEKPAAATPAPAEDHTDDLYFRRGRTRRRKAPDPNQLDLFRSTKGSEEA